MGNNHLLAAIEDFYFSRCRMPSVSELAADAGCSKSTMHSRLVKLAQEGAITYQRGEIMTPKVSALSFGTINCPIVGTVSCGIPQSEDAYIEKYIPLPTAIFGSRDLYILKADGTSMVNAGIDIGDLIVVRGQKHARTGEIVVALVDHRDTTLKRLLWDSREERYYLHPENDSMSDLYFDEIEIQGIAVNVIKTFH